MILDTENTKPVNLELKGYVKPVCSYPWPVQIVNKAVLKK